MWSLLILVFLVIAVAVGVGLVQVPGHEGLHWKQSDRAAKVWMAKGW